MSFRFGIIGCGYVSDFYASAIQQRAGLEIEVVYDIDEWRARSFSEMYGARRAATYDEILSDPAVSAIVNLTPPEDHAPVTLAALRAGKHVFSEKPMALDGEKARELVAEARVRNLVLCVAPSSILSPTAQLVREKLEQSVIGEVKLAYVELDNGAVPLMAHESWRNPRGLQWPAREEFSMGPIRHHLPYYLTWLVSFFGKVTHLTTSRHSLLGASYPEGVDAGPDAYLSTVQFDSGLIARITCGWVAPTDLSLTLIGTRGVMRVHDAWDFWSPVSVQSLREAPVDHEYLTTASVESPLSARFVMRPTYSKDIHSMDFASGLVELAHCASSGENPTVSAELHAHIAHVCDLIDRRNDLRSLHDEVF